MKRMRYIVGAALALGIAAGVWLSDFLKGIGTGSGVGIGQSGLSGVESDVTGSTAELGIGDAAASGEALESIRVVIDDRQYYLQSGATQSPIELDQLLGLVSSAKGDDDGIKLRIYRTESARVTAELQLRDALKSADVPDAAVYTSPEAVSSARGER